MSSTLFNVTSGSITWDKEETDITQDEISYVDIKVVGWTQSTTQGVVAALVLIPEHLPINDAGPVGNDHNLTGAELQRRGIKYSDGMFRLEATYKFYTGTVIGGPGGGSDDKNAVEDKTSLRISTTSQPLLTNPVAMKFPKQERALLSALISGYIRVGIELETTGEAKTGGKEYLKQNVDTGAWDVEAKFSTTSYSVSLSGKTIEASPADYAKLIVAGVTEYDAPTVVFTWNGVRKDGVSASELNKVGSIVKPDRAPTVTDREWLYSGLNEDQITESIHNFQREYLLSGKGGAYKQIYAGGTADINNTP